MAEGGRRESSDEVVDQIPWTGDREFRSSESTTEFGRDFVRRSVLGRGTDRGRREHGTAQYGRSLEDGGEEYVLVGLE